MKLNVFPYNAQHMGRRGEQQDYFAFSNLFDSAETEAIGSVAVLADGMGGLKNGRLAAVAAVETFMTAYRRCEKTVDAAMEEAVYSANQAVLEIPAAGTTLAAVVVMENTLFWRSVGDSRIYLFRTGVLRQLSRDHNYRTELLKYYEEGKIDYMDVWTDPDGEALTAFLGQNPLQKIDGIGRTEVLQTGDRILLCSDGLYRTLEEDRLAQILCRRDKNPAEELLLAAIHKDIENQDNITVLVLDIEYE